MRSCEDRIRSFDLPVITTKSLSEAGEALASFLACHFLCQQCSELRK